MRLPRMRLIGWRWKLAAAGGLAVVVLLSIAARLPTGDAARLQGRWVVLAVEDSGTRAQDEPFLKTRQYVFDGHQAIVQARAGPIAFASVRQWVEQKFLSPSFRLDPSATPKSIDLSFPGGRIMRGIYELDGERLKLCFGGPAGTQAGGTRPVRFTGPASGARLLVLQREGR